MFPWNKMFPFPKEYMKGDSPFKQADVEKWMNKAMKLPDPPPFMNSSEFFMQSFELLDKIQANKKQKRKPSFQPQIYEGHNEVFVKFPISADHVLDVKTYYNSNTCFVENVPNPGNKQTIPLPCFVKTTGSKAIFKDNMLEIRIPKETKTSYTKVPLEFLSKPNISRKS